MTRRPRLLFFAPHFAEISVQLAQALARDYEVMLVIDRTTVRRDLDPAWFAKATRNVRVLGYRADRRYWRALWPPLMMLATALFRPDVAHMQEQADVTSARMARFLARRYPLTVTVHDPSPHKGVDTEFLLEGAQAFRDEIRASAHAFHVHSGFAGERMAADYGDRPIVRTEHGVIHTPKAAQEREPEPGRILFFGRMEAYKGLEVLLDAMDCLNKKGRKYDLVVAGRGESLLQLGERARATPGVTVVDRFLQPSEVADEFQKSALAVLPYLEATQSGVAAAALANSRPVVASRTGGLAEVIVTGHNGILVDPGDAKQLADAIDQALSDPHAYAALAAGAAGSRARLGWDHAAAILDRSYRSLLAKVSKV